MDKRKLSELIATKTQAVLEFKDLEIEVDQSHENHITVAYKFTKCKFTFVNGVSLILSNCEFLDCEFHGLNDSKNNINVTLKSAVLLRDLKMYLFFNMVAFYSCEIYDFHNDSHCNNLKLDIISLYGFNFEGSCGSLYLNKFYAFPSIYSHSGDKSGSLKYLFKSRPSIWKLEIKKNGNIDSAVFNGVKVDPYYLSVRCNVNGSIDLGNAHLIDNWSKLRKEYSGIRLWIIFVMTFFFFLPLFIQYSFLLFKSIGKLLLEKADDTLKNSGVDMDSIFHLKNHFIEKPLWKVLLIGDQTGWLKYLFFLLSIFLISYNILRFVVTMKVSKLKEEETYLSESNFKIMRLHPDKYYFILLIHKCFLWWAYYIALAFLIFRVCNTLSNSVPVYIY